MFTAHPTTQRVLVYLAFCTAGAGLLAGCHEGDVATTPDTEPPPGDTNQQTPEHKPDENPDEPPGLDARPPAGDCRAFTAPPPTSGVRFVDKFPAVALDEPVGLFQRPGDNTRWYVTERRGVIKRFPNDPAATTADVAVVLDLSNVTWTDIDCGLTSIAFPPDFASTHVAYVGYCYRKSGTPYGEMQLRYSRFTSHDGGNTLDRASERIIVAIDYNYEAGGPHNSPGEHAVDVARFGSDGYLYMAFGDGGPQGRIGGQQAQDTYDLRGKILRADVSDLDMFLADDGLVPGRQRIAARFPADNPFAGGGGHPAVYAYGLRNPWSWHFDRSSGVIWVGDVGNSAYEEIDRVNPGGNYGWGYYEGFHCTNGWTAAECAAVDAIPPILEYGHGSGDQQGNSVTGGVVYRGSTVSALAGAYVFADFSNQKVWVMRGVDDLAPGDPMPAKELIGEPGLVSSFAEDQDGEVYITIYQPSATTQGTILAIEPASAPAGTSAGGPPRLLSQTGCFGAGDPRQPAEALIPFAPAAELWSDGATKRRWLAVPDQRTVAVQADGDFEFPPGSVLVKEFSLNGKRVETRFLARQEADGRWAGYTYRWHDDESDAELVGSGGETVTYAGQPWLFPSRSQCGRCHTQTAGHTLGPELGQLNHAMSYPATGRTANQIETLVHIGLLEMTAFGERDWPAFPALSDVSSSIADRARAYLHANCSGCHRPGGPTFTPPDFRYGTSFAAMGICDVAPTVSDLETYIASEPRVFAPGAPERSVLFVRLETTDAGVRMPPLARTIEHTAATDVVGAWIAGTTQCPGP